MGSVPALRPHRTHFLGNPVQFHHVLGRNGKHDRKLHSSILNAIPLSQTIHRGPLRDHPDQRRVYLRIAFEKVAEAIGQGRYELAEIDRAFMLHADEWLKQNNLPVLYT